MPDYKQNMVLPLAKRPHEVVGALCGIIFLFAIPCFADTVYYQPEQTDEIDLEMSDFSSNRTIDPIGSFTITEDHYFHGGSFAYEIMKTGSTCNTSFLYLSVASTSPGSYSNYVWQTFMINPEENLYTVFQGELSSYGRIEPGTYDVYLNTSCNFGSDHIKMRSKNFDFYGLLSDVDGPTETLEDAHYTHFYYLSPAYEAIVASTSPVDFYIGLYVTDADYIDGSYVRLRYRSQTSTQLAIANQDLLWTTLDFKGDIFVPGYNVYSTSTDAFPYGDGTYWVTMELRKPLSWWENTLRFLSLSLYNPDVVVASSSIFVYGDMTPFDRFVASTTSAMSGFVASSTLTMEDAKRACSLSTDFDLTDCLGFLFISPSAFSDVSMTHLKDNLLSFVPLGYITRTVEIMATTSTSSLPVLSYTFATSSAFALPLTGTFSFNPWQYFYTDGSPVKDEIKDSNGKNIWNIFEPITKLIVYLTLFWMILKDLLSLESSENHPKDSKKFMSYGSKKHL